MKKLTKILLLFSMLLGFNICNAQWAVYDASNFAQTLQLLESASEQSKVLGNTYDVLKKANDAYQKVSNAFKNVRLIKDVIDDQAKLVARASNTISNIRKLKNFDGNASRSLITQVDKIITQNESNIELINDFLKDGITMSDGERMQMLRDIQKETNQKDGELKALERRARYFSNMTNSF